MQHTLRNSAEVSACDMCVWCILWLSSFLLENIKVENSFLLLSPVFHHPARERQHVPSTSKQPRLHPARWRLGLGRRLRGFHFHRILLRLSQVPHHLLQGDSGVFLHFLQSDCLGVLGHACFNVCRRSVAKEVSAT